MSVQPVCTVRSVRPKTTDGSEPNLNGKGDSWFSHGFLTHFELSHLCLQSDQEVSCQLTISPKICSLITSFSPMLLNLHRSTFQRRYNCPIINLPGFPEPVGFHSMLFRIHCDLSLLYTSSSSSMLSRTSHPNSP